MSCAHCDAVRSYPVGFHNGQRTYPMKYFSPPGSPGLYDGDPGDCACACHDVWRLFRRLIGGAW